VATDFTPDLATVFFSDFAQDVTPTTWGGDAFPGILDEDYVDAGDYSQVAPILTVARSSVASDWSAGDVLTIDGTAYQVVDVRNTEPDIAQVILRAT
jgi:hypothetical protein